MTNDPIVEEVRKAREAYAAQFGFDLDAMVTDLQRRTEESRRAGHPIAAIQSPTPVNERSYVRWYRDDWVRLLSALTDLNEKAVTQAADEAVALLGANMWLGHEEPGYWVARELIVANGGEPSDLNNPPLRGVVAQIGRLFLSEGNPEPKLFRSRLREAITKAHARATAS
jgi:hypothetical protein